MLRTAWCSIALTTTPRRGSFALAATPRTAMLSDSLPLAVKTTSAGSAPTSAATDARASSTAARARCPNQWRLEGFPYCSRRNGSIASSTRGSTGVVALWSR